MSLFKNSKGIQRSTWCLFLRPYLVPHQLWQSLSQVRAEGMLSLESSLSQQVSASARYKELADCWHLILDTSQTRKRKWVQELAKKSVVLGRLSFCKKLQCNQFGFCNPVCKTLLHLVAILITPLCSKPQNRSFIWRVCSLVTQYKFMSN